MRLSERFVDVWVLLSDTDRFVSRARLMKLYEGQLRFWRSRLQSNQKDSQTMAEVRREIVIFRRARRTEGWELRLGSLDLAVRGFRSDDAMGVGFRRLVLALGKEGRVHYLVGDDNHIQLDKDLRSRMSGVLGDFSFHYLWYRRSEGVIELAGSDSENREDLEELHAYVEAHKSDLLKTLSRLR